MRAPVIVTQRATLTLPEGVVPLEVARYGRDVTWWAYAPALELGAGGPTAAAAVAALARALDVERTLVDHRGGGAP